MEQLRFGYKIREVAGSPVLTIPRHLLRRLSLAIGDVVTLGVSNGKLVIEPMKRTDNVILRGKPKGKLR